MREYELVYILTPDISDESLSDAMDRVNRMVTGRGATINESQRWGRRRLAYPIKRFLEGTYVVSQLQMTPERAVDVDNGLKLAEEVLRHLLVRRD